MLITPTGIPYEKLTESHIALLMATANMRKENSPQASGVPYGGLSKQTGCQRGCSQSCRHCTAVSILNRPIPAIHYMIGRLAVILFLARLMRPLEHANF